LYSEVCCVPWYKLVDDHLIDGEKIPEASWRNLIGTSDVIDGYHILLKLLQENVV